MELSASTATLSPLAMPSAWRALARRLTRSWSAAKVRLSPPQVRATRSGTTEAAIIRNSLAFIHYLRKRSLYAPPGQRPLGEAALQRQPLGQRQGPAPKHGPPGPAARPAP